MVDMQLSNKKLLERGVLMIMEELKIDETLAANLLEEHKSVREVFRKYKG